MCMDASTLELGAVVIQCDERGNNHIIAYALFGRSQLLYNTPRNLSVGKRFKTFSRYEITMYTNHAAVTKQFKGRNLTGKLPRWYLTIQNFSPKCKYLQRRSDVITDALSRN